MFLFFDYLSNRNQKIITTCEKKIVSVVGIFCAKAILV